MMKTKPSNEREASFACDPFIDNSSLKVLIFIKNENGSSVVFCFKAGIKNHSLWSDCTDEKVPTSVPTSVILIVSASTNDLLSVF